MFHVPGWKEFGSGQRIEDDEAAATDSEENDETLFIPGVKATRVEDQHRFGQLMYDMDYRRPKLSIPWTMSMTPQSFLGPSTARNEENPIEPIPPRRRSSLQLQPDAVDIVEGSAPRRISFAGDGHSPLFDTRLEAYVETLIETEVHKQMYQVVMKRVEAEMYQMMAHSKVCKKHLVDIKGDLQQLTTKRAKFEQEKAEMERRLLCNATGMTTDSQNPVVRRENIYTRLDNPETDVSVMRLSGSPTASIRSETTSRRADRPRRPSTSSIDSGARQTSHADMEPARGPRIDYDSAAQAAEASVQAYQDEILHKLEQIRTSHFEQVLITSDTDESITIGDMLECANFSQHMDFFASLDIERTVELLSTLIHFADSLYGQLDALLKELRWQRSGMEIEIAKKNWQWKGSGRMHRNLRNHVVKAKGRSQESLWHLSEMVVLEGVAEVERAKERDRRNDEISEDGKSWRARWDSLLNTLV